MKELLKKAKLGDENATKEIIKSFQGFIYNKCKTYKISGYEIEDLMQEGNIAIFKAIQKYDLERDSFVTYCTKTITNTFRDLFKRNINKERNEINKVDFIEFEDTNCEIEKDVLSDVYIGEIQNFLKDIPKGERDIISNMYIEGTSLRNSAKICNMSYQEALSARKRGLNRLKNSKCFLN